MRTLLLLLIASFSLFAQPSDVSLNAPVPQMPVISAGTIGNPGTTVYVYYAIAHYGGGTTVSQPAIVTNAPNTLSGSNYVNIGWNALAGAASYDVVRITPPNQFTGSCTCSVATGLTTVSVSDTGSSLGVYVLAAGAVGANGTIYINNRDYIPPQLRQIINGVDSPIGGGQGGVSSYGNTIFVDAVNGNNNSGKRGNSGLPFLTIRAAITAAGITSGDVIHVRPGTYDETSVANTEVVFPDGVSLLCDPGAILEQTTASTFIVAFIPGSNSTWSGCTFTGNQNRTPQMALLGIDANLTGTIPTNVTLRNLTVNGGSDSLYLRATNTVATAAHWTIYDCTFNSHFDSFVVITLHTSGADTPWPIVVDLYNSTFNTTYNSSDAGTTYRAIISDTTGATVNVYGGTASASGGVSGEAAGVWNRGGSTINLLNPVILVSAVGASTYSVHNVYSALRSSPSQVINIYPGTSYNTSAVLNDVGAGAGVVNSGFVSAGIAFADIGTAVAGGSKWIFDGTPATSPCSGSGNGAWAFATSTAPGVYQWKCQ